MTPDLKIVIPSKHRHDSIAENTLRLFPEAIVCVDEIERDAYAAVVASKRIVLHPSVDELPSLGSIRNWILNHITADVLVMADDDVSHIRAMAGWRPRDYRDPDVAEAAVVNAANCAMEAGAGLFGFNQQPHPLHFKPQAPIKLDTWVGSVIGFVGNHGLRYDERFSLHDDVDLSLQSLMKHRIVWCDERWSFRNKRITNAGGLATIRSTARYEEEHKLLKEKWVSTSAIAW